MKVEPMNKLSYNSWVTEDNKKKIHEQEKTVGFVLSVTTREFFAEWSVAGLKYVVKSNTLWIRRLVWLVLVLFGFGFMIFQFYDRITYFLSHPTSVDIKVNNKPEITFPTVTICNENIVDKNDAADIHGMTDLIPNMYPAWPNPIFVPNFDEIPGVTTYLQSANLTWDAVWSHMSTAKNNRFMERCTFTGQNCLGDDVNIVATSMGFCAQFNGARLNFTSTKSGASKGLYMLLNTNQDNYLYTKSRAAGFRVLLHTKNDVPLVEELGFKISVNHVTSVALKLKSVTNLPQPYGNCSATADYIYNNCVDTCLHEYINKTCGCRYHYYKSFTDDNACDPQQQYECADVAANIFKDNKLLDELCVCPPQCHKDFYQYTLSAATSSDYAMKTVAKTICAYYGSPCSSTEEAGHVAHLRKNYAELEVYFDELLHEEVITKPSYNILALLCDIGGALGLILGSTILTLFEILDFILVFLYKGIVSYACGAKSKSTQRIT